MSDGRGPVVGTALRVVVRHDPLSACEVCGGSGEYIDRDTEAPYDCPCCEDTYREPTVDEVRAWLAEREVQRG